MKILIVSSYLPYPLINGGHIRLYNLIKQLSKMHKITLICEKRDFQTEENRNELEKLCEEVVTVSRRKQWSIKNILKTGFSRYPFLLIGHTNPDMKARIVEILNSKTFDVIHVETFYVMQNVPKTYIPIVLVEHNIEYLVYKRYADNAKAYLRPLLYADVWKIKYWEEYFWKKATKLVAVSEDEKKLMKREDVVVVPNGVDTAKFSAKGPASGRKLQKKEKRILFIGDFKWIQNRQSVEWILKEIWPEIESRIKNVSFSKTTEDKRELRIKLWIVGKNIPKSLKILGNESVLFDENAPRETWKIFQQSAVLLAPIKVGGGTQYKILEAMASGVPVITTSLGIEGLQVDPRQDALVADTTEELAEQTVTVLQNEKLYETIATRARKAMENTYNWDVIAKQLDEVYKSAVSV